MFPLSGEAKGRPPRIRREKICKSASSESKLEASRFPSSGKEVMERNIVRNFGSNVPILSRLANMELKNLEEIMFKVEANLKEIAGRQLSQRRARKEGEPRRPVTTVHCKALHGLQFRATVEGHSFISDEGDEAGGHDAGPAPLRYFLAGIMMCHQVWCVKSAALLRCAA